MKNLLSQSEGGERHCQSFVQSLMRQVLHKYQSELLEKECSQKGFEARQKLAISEVNIKTSSVRQKLLKLITKI